MTKALAIGCNKYLGSTAGALLPPGKARSSVMDKASMEGIFALLHEHPGIRVVIACLDSSDLRDLYHVQALREMNRRITLVALFDVDDEADIARRTVRSVLMAFAGEAAGKRAHPLHREPQPRKPEALGYRLTPRQKDVLFLMREGKSNKDIARELDLCEGTVKLHCMAVLRVLKASNRTQAALLAKEFLLAPPVLERAAVDLALGCRRAG